MTEIYVDAYLLSCPPPGSKESEYTHYVNTLTELESAHSHGCVKLLVPSDTIFVLEAAGAMPPWEKSDLDNYVQREEVSKLLFGLLTRLSTIEDYLQITDLLVEDESFDPEQHLVLRAQDFVDSYTRTVGFLCLAADLKVLGTDVLMTKGLKMAIIVKVSGQIAMADFVDKGIDIDLPRRIRREVRHVPSLEVLCTLLDPVDIWKSGHIRKAIDLAIFQLIRPGNEIWPDVEYSYLLHSAFDETAGILDTDTKIHMALRACAEAFTKGNMRDEHRLRKGGGANAEPIMRKSDKATAWRRDIDHELHLHYWRTSTSIELAVVVPHNDFKIPE